MRLFDRALADRGWTIAQDQRNGFRASTLATRQARDVSPPTPSVSAASEHPRHYGKLTFSRFRRAVRHWLPAGAHDSLELLSSRWKRPQSPHFDSRRGR
jgi:hypothetical protein